MYSYDGIHYTDHEYNAAEQVLSLMMACNHANASTTTAAQPMKPTMTPGGIINGLLGLLLIAVISLMFSFVAST
jgi:hypothetical protein